MISEARKLVASIPQMNFQVVGVLLGHNIKDKANDVIAHGADKVIVVDDALLEGYSTQFYADAPDTGHQQLQAGQLPDRSYGTWS